MMYPLVDQLSNGQRAVKRLYHFTEWTLVYLTVVGPGTVYFSQRQSELENQIEGQNQGIPQVSADGTKPYWWRGDFYIWASASGTYAELQAISGGAGGPWQN